MPKRDPTQAKNAVHDYIARIARQTDENSQESLAALGRKTLEALKVAEKHVHGSEGVYMIPETQIRELCRSVSDLSPGFIQEAAFEILDTAYKQDYAPEDLDKPDPSWNYT